MFWAEPALVLMTASPWFHEDLATWCPPRPWDDLAALLVGQWFRLDSPFLPLLSVFRLMASLPWNVAYVISTLGHFLPVFPLCFIPSRIPAV